MALDAPAPRGTRAAGAPTESPIHGDDLNVRAGGRGRNSRGGSGGVKRWWSGRRGATLIATFHTPRPADHRSPSPGTPGEGGGEGSPRDGRAVPDPKTTLTLTLSR